MLGLGNIAEVKQQQHQDNLRRVERERLAAKATTTRETLGVLQGIGNGLFGLFDKQKQDHQAGPGRLADETSCR